MRRIFDRWWMQVGPWGAGAFLIGIPVLVTFFVWLFVEVVKWLLRANR